MNQTARYKPGSWQAEPHPDDYQESILRALAYFDIFHYPLSAEEIKLFMDLPADCDKLDTALRQLVASFKIYCHSNWYSLHDNPLLAVRRQRGNQRASELIYKAHKIGRFLYRFPFVRAVGISGSLSKQFASEDADIDFFIITRNQPHRLSFFIAFACGFFLFPAIGGPLVKAVVEPLAKLIIQQ